MINMEAQDLKMGDFIEVPFHGRTCWLMVIDKMDPIPYELVTEENKYKYDEYQVKYWREKYNMVIENPLKIILAVHFLNEGSYYCYPINVIKNVKHSELSKEKYNDFMNEITEPARNELAYKFKSRLVRRDRNGVKHIKLRK